MKRIQYACLEQTIHFMLKDDLGHAAAVSAVRHELENYKKSLTVGRVKYRIVDESIQPDDSIVLKIKKQYNSYAVGDYLN